MIKPGSAKPRAGWCEAIDKQIVVTVPQPLGLPLEIFQQLLSGSWLDLFEVKGVKKQQTIVVFTYGVCLNMASGRLREVPQGSLRHHFGHHLGVWGAPEAAFWGYHF